MVNVYILMLIYYFFVGLFYFILEALIRGNTVMLIFHPSYLLFTLRVFELFELGLKEKTNFFFAY